MSKIYKFVQNNSMFGTIIFLSLLFVFLSLMLIICIAVRFDYNNARIFISVSIYKIQILKLDIDLLLLRFKINNSKYKRINLLFSIEQKYLINQIKDSVIKKLYYDDVIIESNIHCGDPKETIDILNLLNIACYVLKQFVANNINNDLNFEFNNKASFIKSSNMINLKIKVMFTIFDMLFAIIISFAKRGKYVKQKKQTNNR